MLRDMARLTRRGFLVAGAGVVVAAGGLAAGRGRIRDLIRDEPALEKPPKGDFPPPRRIVQLQPSPSIPPWPRTAALDPPAGSS